MHMAWLIIEPATPVNSPFSDINTWRNFARQTLSWHQCVAFFGLRNLNTN